MSTEPMRPTVCLSFDFDAISVWLSPLGLSSPQYISRGEFAANVGAPRVLDLLEREGVVATWFIPGLDAETYPDMCRRIRDAGHEIGHHGYAHEPPTSLDEAGERLMYERGLEALDRVLGVRPSGYRSPAADLSDASTRLLAEFGFRYDTSLWGGDFQPYRCRTGDTVDPDRGMLPGRELDLVEVPIGTVNDFSYFEFAMLPPMLMPANVNVDALGRRWLTDLDFMTRHVPDGVFAPVFHPQAIGRGSRIRLLERLIHRAKEHDAEFITLDSAVRRWTTTRVERTVPRPEPPQRGPASPAWSIGKRQASS